MKDKEKQIEEMAKIIDDRLIEARGYLGSMNKGSGYWIAQKLIEHYQPKLPEDSVVLSREEYEKLKSRADNKCRYDCDLIDMPDFEREKTLIEKTRKETTEKIFKELILNSKIKYDTACDKLVCVVDIIKLAKQFGVEIKE